MITAVIAAFCAVMALYQTSQLHQSDLAQVQQKDQSTQTTAQAVTQSLASSQMSQLQAALNAASGQIQALSAQLAALSALPEQIKDLKGRVSSLENNFNGLRDKEFTDKAARDLQFQGLDNRIGSNEGRVQTLENGPQYRNPPTIGKSR